MAKKIGPLSLDLRPNCLLTAGIQLLFETDIIPVQVRRIADQVSRLELNRMNWAIALTEIQMVLICKHLGG